MAVGSVTERGARLWYRSGRSGRLWLWLAPEGEASERPWPIAAPFDAARDGTGAVTFPDDFAAAPLLEPGRRHRFRITRSEGAGEAAAGGGSVGEGCFETAPRAADRRSQHCFAVMSCHQPFGAAGAITPRAGAMLERLEPALDARGAKYSVLLGDQMYADSPAAFSLFSPGGPLARHARRPLPAAALRAAYQRRYRQFWHTAMGSCLAQRPSYVALDDHEIADNWGSRPEHLGDSWRRVRAAALDAAFDYQLARNLPEARRRGPYFHSFRWGRTATFVADIRSERWAERDRGRILSEEQLAALAAFLEQHDDCGALFVALPVPIVFLPGWFMRVALAWPGEHPAARDRWTWPGWQGQVDRVLELLLRQRRRRPRQQLVLLSGDIHESLVAALHPPGGMPIYQLVSSPVTNTSRGLLPWLAHQASRTIRSIACNGARLPVTLLTGTPGAGENPHADLNVGLVTVDADAEEARLRFEILAPVAGEPGLQAVYDSGPLGHGPPQLGSPAAEGSAAPALPRSSSSATLR